jgi:nickel-dependent lactate racemase
MDFKRQRFLIIACGYHVLNTLGEIEKMLGSHLASRLKIVNHDGEDEPNLTFVGNSGSHLHLSIDANSELSRRFYVRRVF